MPPQPRSAIPATRPIQCPSGRVFSSSTKVASPTIQYRFIVRLRDVLGAFDDRHGLGQDARIGWWPIGGVGAAAVSRQALADDLLGRAPPPHPLAAGGCGWAGN